MLDMDLMSFVLPFIYAVFAVKMPWHVLRQTFIDLPSSAISAVKRCSLLQRSGPAPTRHECQIASKVDFPFTDFELQYLSVFPFSCLQTQQLFTDLVYCRLSSII